SWPSPPSTGSPPPPTSSSSKASPTGNGNDSAVTSSDEPPRPAGPLNGHPDSSLNPLARPSETTDPRVRSPDRLTPTPRTRHPHHAARWSHAGGNAPVPSSWQATRFRALAGSASF